MYGRDYVSPEEIERARTWDIVSYLERFEPGTLIRKSPTRSEIQGHDSFIISPNGKWRWCSQGFGGNNALDFLIKVRGMTFQNAVHMLNENDPLPTPSVQQHIPERIPFILPEKNENDLAVTAYLLRRGITPAVIDMCKQKGLLYESKKYHNAVFVGLDKHGAPRYAALHGIYKNGIKMDVAGSEKRFSFSIPAESNDLAVFESPIDLLSWRSYMPQDTKAHLLSLGGVAGGEDNLRTYRLPVSLERYLEDYGTIHQIYLCLDADKAGRLATRRITERLSKDYKIIDAPPPLGKDYWICQENETPKFR